MVTTPCVATVALYFDKQRHLAANLSSIGGALGSLTGPIAAVSIIEKFGLAGSFLVFGGLCLNIIAAGALFRPLPTAAKEEIRQRKQTDGNLVSVCEISKLILSGTNIMLYKFGAGIVLTFAVKYATEQGLSTLRAAQLYSSLQISSICTRLLLLLVTGRSWFRHHLAYNIGTCIQGLTAFLFLLVRSPAVFSICCCLFGIAIGTKRGINTVVYADLFGVQNILLVEGICAMCFGIGIVVAGPSAGKFMMFF